MSKRKRLIPFSWLPASWGLKGQVYDEACAAYYYEGKDLDVKLAEIRNADDKTALKVALVKIAYKHDELDEYTYDLELLKLQEAPETLASAELDLALKYHKISEYEYDVESIKLEYPEEGTDRALALIDIETKHGKISEQEGQKQRANLLKAPWIGVVEMGIDVDRGLGGVYFEFDWNEHWIEYLRLNGYLGLIDEQVVENWFADVCRSQGMNTMLASEGAIIPFNGRVVNNTRTD